MSQIADQIPVLRHALMQTLAAAVNVQNIVGYFFGTTKFAAPNFSFAE
ncbi:hypothetical protein ACU8OG_10625 [Rhizobium leguminosarum]